MSTIIDNISLAYDAAQAGTAAAVESVAVAVAGPLVSADFYVVTRALRRGQGPPDELTDEKRVAAVVADVGGVLMRARFSALERSRSAAVAEVAVFVTAAGSSPRNATALETWTYAGGRCIAHRQA